MFYLPRAQEDHRDTRSANSHSLGMGTVNLQSPPRQPRTGIPRRTLRWRREGRRGEGGAADQPGGTRGHPRGAGWTSGSSKARKGAGGGGVATPTKENELHRSAGNSMSRAAGRPGRRPAGGGGTRPGGCETGMRERFR